MRPDAQNPVWLCKSKRRVKGFHQRNLSGIPDPELPMSTLPDAWCTLRELGEEMLDRNHSTWRRYATSCRWMVPVCRWMVPVCRGEALSACHVVRPCKLLRRLQVLLQELLLELQLLMGDQPHRASFVPAADSDAGQAPPHTPTIQTLQAVQTLSPLVALNLSLGLMYVSELASRSVSSCGAVRSHKATLVLYVADTGSRSATPGSPAVGGTWR